MVGTTLGKITLPTMFITSGENGLIDLGKLKIYAFVAFARNPSGNSVFTLSATRGYEPVAVDTDATNESTAFICKEF